MRDHRWNGAVENFCRTIIEQLRTNKALISEVSFSDILYSLHKKKSELLNAPQNRLSYIWEEIQHIIMYKYKSTGNHFTPDLALCLTEKDFTQEAVFAILVREQSWVTELDGTFEKFLGRKTDHKITFLLDCEQQTVIYAKRDISTEIKATTSPTKQGRTKGD